MSRTISRSVAKRHYAKFSRLWRDDLRRAGLYGVARSPKRPTFNQWYAMHMQDIALTKESTPADVREHLGLTLEADPWAEQPKPLPPPVEQFEAVSAETGGQRGVMTIDIVDPAVKK